MKCFVKSECINIKPLSLVDAVYLAALIDGEGCIRISKNYVSRDTPYYLPQITIGNTHPVMIEFCNKFGGSYQYCKSHGNNKGYYVWNWTIPMCKLYVPQMLPYLKIKHEQGVILLKALKYCNGLTKRYKLRKIRMKKYREQLAMLNHRGIDK